MIGCLRVRKQSIIALYFESENELKFYNLEYVNFKTQLTWLNNTDYNYRNNQSTCQTHCRSHFSNLQ